MESLLNCLKQELETPVSYDVNSYENIAPHIKEDYDEIFYDFED
jgi:hypothetical protein